jgi:hypothetical protein
VKATALLDLPAVQRPEGKATDKRGEIHLVDETTAVLLIGQEIDGQRKITLEPSLRVDEIDII